MKEKMKQLILLQDYDIKIGRILKIINEAPIKIQKLDDELKSHLAKFREDTDKLESLKKERHHTDQEVLEFEAKIEKSNTKLLNIKSNKEYKAALKEIEDTKHILSLAEDRALETMERIEDLEKKGRENKKTETELREKYQKERDKIEQEIEGLNTELAKLEGERNRVCQLTEQDLLQKYLFLKDRRGGLAVSAVISGVCQTCHIAIPPQKFNELIKGNALLTCPNCLRIIYWGEDKNLQIEGI